MVPPPLELDKTALADDSGDTLPARHGDLPRDLGERPTSFRRVEPLVTNTLIANRYRVGKLLGTGAMGQVYMASDESLGRTVALKLLLKDDGAGQMAGGLRQRLEREARALAKLSHPNVVGVYEIGDADDQIFMAMEYIAGTTLDVWLRDEGRPWSEVLSVFLQAGRGLAAAHEAGLVHRDFKPSNVMVGDDGGVRVLDFGLVRALAGAVETSQRGVEMPKVASIFERPLTKTGAVIGTPAYMAPEQMESRPADARTDQFSFCVGLYEGLYRTRPFAGEQWFELIANVIEGRLVEPPATSDVPPTVFQILRRGLVIDPGKRWPSMKALLEALENHNSKAVMASASSHLAKGRPSWAPVVGVIVIVLLAVLAAMFATD